MVCECVRGCGDAVQGDLVLVCFWDNDLAAEMKQPVGKIVRLMLPLLFGACVICGSISYRLNDSVGILLLLVSASAMVIYHRTLQISLWKSVSILLAVCAVFACVNSISRAVNAKLTADLNITQNEPWFCLKAEIFYNAICNITK